MLSALQMGKAVNQKEVKEVKLLSHQSISEGLAKKKKNSQYKRISRFEHFKHHPD